MDLDEKENSKSKLRAAADDRLSSFPDVFPKLKEKTPEEINGRGKKDSGISA